MAPRRAANFQDGNEAKNLHGRHGGVVQIASAKIGAKTMKNSDELIMRGILEACDPDEVIKMAEAAKASKGPTEADKAAITSKNPFAKGPNFSLSEQARLYVNPATRALAIGLAKTAGVTLPDKPTARDLRARGASGE